MEQPTAEIKQVFRYRDLTAATLTEHRSLITSTGSCWWGWWKRPTEDGRPDVWQKISATLAAGNHATVGLFDSGSGLVHSAVVTAVVMPKLSKVGEAESVFPTAESDLIPEYYRTSRYSRGWLKIEIISEHPVDFFGRYSYDDPPPLHQYSFQQLEQLRNKRVASPAELRAMDTTIWEVRVSVSGDRSGELILATPSLTPSLSGRAVECTGDWILHLTDLHYATESHRDQHRWRLESEPGHDGGQSLADAVHEAVTRAGRDIGAVVVTGDLTFVGSADEYRAAESGLRKLVDGNLGRTMDHLVVVPGNHDIKWTTGDDRYDDGGAINLAPEKATEQYRAFFQRIFGREAQPSLAMARRFVMPGGNMVDVVAVNSSSLEQGKDFLAGMGRVQESAFREACNALGWARNGTALRVLALHHHLANTDNLERAEEYRSGFGIAIDATRTIRMAAKTGVHLALHGHRHRAFVWRVGATEPVEDAVESWDLGHINIVGGGSAGSTAADGNNNYFNLIRCVADTLELEIYKATNGGSFESISSWQASIARSGSASEIGPWVKSTSAGGTT